MTKAEAVTCPGRVVRAKGSDIECQQLAKTLQALTLCGDVGIVEEGLLQPAMFVERENLVKVVICVHVLWSSLRELRYTLKFSACKSFQKLVSYPTRAVLSVTAPWHSYDLRRSCK